MMENGSAPNGLSTNHDHQSAANGAPNHGLVNGAVGPDAQQSTRMNDLPAEIQHITEGFVPLGKLLSRLAQSTHNELQTKILAWAKMPVPSAHMLNGNASHDGSSPDDPSPENMKKKADILHFIQETHARWVKALVITAWSRKVEPVSKLIDLQFHLKKQRDLYWESFYYLTNIKRDLTFARVPNPDLSTALHVLSSGEAPWMPDLGYIEPPPLAPKEKLQWIETLNTLLSLRLNLDDHDKIPYHFQRYDIKDGRVTFHVPGEFQVDLTIADEDFEKQFWFIGFRFDFTPAPDDLTDTLRHFLEGKVNEVLEKDGLLGCYRFLHEFVLTHKITEFVRQGHELNRGSWVDTLKIERLNRSMAIQYWVGRYPPDGPKSWFILGVDSGKKPDIAPGPKTTSRLALRWFRDNKEIKDVKIPLDDATISTGRLLKDVIGRHIEHMLTSIYKKLSAKGRFSRREAALALGINHEDPVQSGLKMQLSNKKYATVRIAPTTGQFSITPQSTVTFKGEHRLNRMIKDPEEEGVASLESIRCQYTVDEMKRRGKSMGWEMVTMPVRSEDIKQILNTRENFQNIWFRRKGWPDAWYMMLSLGLGGDRWWLIETSGVNAGNGSNNNQSARVVTYSPLRLSSGPADLSDNFYSELTHMTGAMIASTIDLRAINHSRLRHKALDHPSSSISPTVKTPAIFIHLSDILSQKKTSDGKGKKLTWARDYVEIVFKGVKHPGSRTPRGRDPSEESRLCRTVDARLKVNNAERLSHLKNIVERDVSYNKRLGVFALRLKAELGQSILGVLAARLQAIEKLVECIEAIRGSNRDITCEDIALNSVSFSYSTFSKVQANETSQDPNDRWKASFDLKMDKIKLRLDRGNPQLRIIDILQNIVNSDLRFTKVPYYLSATLPLMRAFHAIEKMWAGPSIVNKGQVAIFPVYIDWYNIHYSVWPPGKPGQEKKATIQVRLKERHGQLQWHVLRVESGPNANPQDVFSPCLQAVWAKDGPWTNLVHSAACRVDEGIEALLLALDEAMRSVQVLSIVPSPTMTKSQAKGPAQTKVQAPAKNQAGRKNSQAGTINRAPAIPPHPRPASNKVVDLT